MRLLIYLLRGFVYFAGITPPSPETERRTAILLFIAIVVGAAILGVLLFVALPAMFR